jgi:LacI family transcriptional regulator
MTSASRPKRTTQRDVARLAGVSQTTVSMVMSGSVSPSIPQETWDRVLTAARGLNYTPNRFAQALKTNRTMTVACVVPDISNPFYPALLRGVHAVADEADYDVITINTDGAADRERRFLRWCLQGRIDGVVGVFFTLHAPDFKPLTEAGIGIVRVEASVKKGGPLPIDNLYVDNHAAAEAVSGYRATRRLLNEGNHGTAIFAANDLMAVGAMAAIHGAGLKIPSDIAVAGFDDIFAARIVTPALTTVAQSQYELGTAAAEMLLDRLQGRNPAEGTSREMPFRLIERQST